ncbi:hypothetical protein T06_9701 [Trichinella sp. T6]|nr:hypothetical protein T06_9701 [Trichinella sp. T6]
MIGNNQPAKTINSSYTSVILSNNVYHLYFCSLTFHSSLRTEHGAVCPEVACDFDDGIIMPYNYIHISTTSKVISTSLLFH